MKTVPSLQNTVLRSVEVFERLRLGLVEEVLAEVTYLTTDETSLPVVLNRVIESIVVVDRTDLKSDFFRALIVLLVTRHLHESVRLLDLQLRFTELP